MFGNLTYPLRLVRSAAVLERGQRYAPPFLMLAGVGLAIYGQYILTSDREISIFGGPLYLGLGTAAFLFGALLGRGSLHVQAPWAVVAFGPLGARQWVGLGLAVAGGSVGFLLNGNNTFTLPGALVWLLGMAALLWAFWEPAPAAKARRIDMAAVGTLVALALITGIAAFLRLDDLASLPREMSGDHADALFAVRNIWNGNYPVYSFQVHGIEPAPFYFAAALTPFFGYSFLSLKLASAIIGILSVPAMYLMTRQLFGSRRIALIAAALIALSYWHIIHTRVHGHIYPPLFVALTLLFFFRALESGRRLDYLACGLALGFGLYSDTPLRPLPLAIGLSLLLGIIISTIGRKGRILALAANAALLVFAATVVYAPMGRFWLDDPESYWLRTRVVTNDFSVTPDMFLRNFQKAMLIFNWRGDSGGFNLPGSPQADHFTGGLLAIGSVAALAALPPRRRHLYGHALLAFMVLTLPAILSLQEGFSMRATGQLPLVYAAAAVPLGLAWHSLEKSFGRAALVAAIPMVAIALGFVGFWNYQRYFDEYAQWLPRNVHIASEKAALVREWADSGGKLENAYIKGWPYWFDEGAFAIELGDLDWQNWVGIDDVLAHRADKQTYAAYLGRLGYIGAIELQAIRSAPPREPLTEGRLYLFNLADTEALGLFPQIYPEGRTYRFKSAVDPRSDFFVFLVPVPGQSAMPLPNTYFIR